MSNTPKIRFAGFTEEWQQRKFKDNFEMLTNNTLSRADLNDDSGTVSTIHYGDILVKFGEVINLKNEKLPFISDTTNIPKTTFLQEGDIIIADTAEDTTVGKCVEITGVLDLNVQAGLHTVPCRPKTSFATGYLGYFMNSPLYHDQLFPLMQGTKVTSVSKTALQTTVLCYPPDIEEQADIGQCFIKLDKLITLHQRKYEKLVSLKAACLGKMFPQSDNKVPEVRFAGYTDDWNQRKLGAMGTTFTGLSGKTKEDFGHGEGRFVTYMNVYLNPVSDIARTEPVEIDTSQNAVQYGDVFFTTSSETPDEVGMSSVWLGKSDNVYLNSFCFGFRPTTEIDPLYMAYMLRSEMVRKKITYLAQGISRYNISKNRVMEIEVPLPDLDEQKLIGQYFNSLDKLIALHQCKLEKFKQVKQAMLHNMFV